MKQEAVFQIVRGSLQDRFMQSRAKVQLYGGGFANGKTSGSCIKGLDLALQYPGSNGLIARETRPKLADTIMKEWLKWCPQKWIKSFPRGVNSANTCTLTNGTEINFRYIAQQKKGSNEGTSNLLSATYDWIIVDQMEDPGIVEKDFDDLIGRLRGSTPYAGDDRTMPQSGPRWFVVTCNPTRGWLYRKIVRPLHLYQETGRVSPDLLCVRDRHTSEPILDADGNVQLLIEIFEGSTYENARNLDDDFLMLLESRYQGSMKERFLLGQWAAYSGLIYPQYDDTIHSVSQQSILEYLNRLQQQGYKISWYEAYDFGIAVASCYSLAFVDPFENVILVDGFYQSEMPIGAQASRIKEIRETYGAPMEPERAIFADPQIFRRGPGGKNVVGKTVAAMFLDDDGIRMQRGNNNISNGIVKVQAHLNIYKNHQNPFTGAYGAPHVFHSDHLDWISDEINEYVWKTDQRGDLDGDKPVDSKDHAMDMIKYMLTDRPMPSVFLPPQQQMPSYMYWQEQDVTTTRRRNAHRYQ